MSPRKSRRRIFAAPFVLTAALTSGCVVREAPPPQPQTQPETRYDENGNEVTTKPIDTSGPARPSGTGSNEVGEPTGGDTPKKPLPPVIVNPPPPQTLPDAPTDAKGTVVTREDGTCWFQYVVDCPPKATCNPPPPKQVKCEK